MKRLQLLLVGIITSIFFSSCVIHNDFDDSVSLNELVTSYDLWYVDIHRTTGNGSIPFLQKAFTISFLNGRMYSNNNIVDIGKTGNGLGIRTGNYNGFENVLEIEHKFDGFYDFEVVQLSENEIRLNDLQSNLSYYLIGYQRNEFDYDKLFYDNIEYFLQEFIAWERVDTTGGNKNPFDKEHFLQFTPENNTTFYSSHNDFGTDIDFINWDFTGRYTIKNPIGISNLKYLTLYYDSGDIEEFDLSVINDDTIKLFHINSETTYTFKGKGFSYILRKNKENLATNVRNNNRQRTKIQRETVQKRN